MKYLNTLVLFARLEVSALSRAILSLVFLSLISFSSYSFDSEKSDYRFNHLGVSDGLPSLMVNKTFQQKSGYIWFATYSGATRYDGKTFKNYSYSPGSDTHITNSYIHDISEDSLGNIWLSTEDGFNKIMPNGKVSHFKSGIGVLADIKMNWVSSVKIDRGGRTWIGHGDGLIVIDGDKNASVINAFDENNNPLPHFSVYAIIFGENSDTYLTTSAGLFYYDISRNVIKRFVSSDGQDHMNDSSYSAIYSDGILWVGTDSHGFYSYNISNDFFKSYPLGKVNGLNPSDFGIMSLSMVDDDSIWLGYDGNGIGVFNISSKTYSFIGEKGFNDYSILTNSVQNIFKDNSGLIWISTSGGVSYYSPLKLGSHIYLKKADGSGISENSIYGIAHHKDILIVNNRRDLNIINLSNGEITKKEIFGDGNVFDSGNGWQVSNGVDSDIWMATTEGIIIYNAETGLIKKYENSPNNKYGIPGNDLYTVAPDKIGGAWFTGYGDVGLFYFHPDTGVTKQFLNKSGNSYFDNQSYSLDMLIDSSGNPWITTTNSIYMYDKKSNLVNHIPLINGKINIRTTGIVQDNNGKIWVSTDGLGVFGISHVDGGYLVDSNINIDSGLPSNQIKGIALDNDVIWMTAGNTLAKYNTKTKRTFVYPSLFSDKNISFIDSLVKVNGKNILLGTNQGLIVVNKNTLTSNVFNPPVYINSIFTNGKKQYLGNKSLKDKFYEINDNSIKFSFSALDYVSPDQNQYRYMLEGFDKGWIFSENMSHASYTNLDAGEYTFRVQGSNSDGVWSNKEDTFTFRVKQGPAFYVIISLLTFTVLLGAIFWYSRQQKLRELHKRANFDDLTGLSNRFRFNNFLDETIEGRTKEFALIFIDLDHFKEVNDSMGHHVGDQLIGLVSERLRRCLRNQDMLARLGGDEFAIIITEPNDDNKLDTIIARIHKILGSGYNLSNKIIKGSASIGVAIYPANGEDSETLLKNADTAMYAAKNAGRNGVYYFDDNLSKDLQKKLLIRSRLHEALKKNEFTLAYQPKVCCVTGDVMGFEALIRWIHPIDGFISPVDFIPEAESNGTIVEIGEWVLREACTQASSWHKKGLLKGKVSVNLSPIQIAQENLIERIKLVLDETGLPANKLELEITETVLMDNDKLATKTFNGLKALGIAIALDDFGTGFSSLSYLSKYKFDTIKIDRSFVSKMEEDPETAAIIESIFFLAGKLNMQVVAEGVETIEQKVIISDFKCDLIQGYYYSPPVKDFLALEMLENGIHPEK
jgi:diguanylate cyclase (GGDEF)-like protein